MMTTLTAPNRSSKITISPLLRLVVLSNRERVHTSIRCGTTGFRSVSEDVSGHPVRPFAAFKQIT